MKNKIMIKNTFENRVYLTLTTWMIMIFFYIICSEILPTTKTNYFLLGLETLLCVMLGMIRYFTTDGLTPQPKALQVFNSMGLLLAGLVFLTSFFYSSILTFPPAEAFAKAKTFIVLILTIFSFMPGFIFWEMSKRVHYLHIHIENIHIRFRITFEH